MELIGNEIIILAAQVTVIVGTVIVAIMYGLIATLHIVTYTISHLMSIFKSKTENAQIYPVRMFKPVVPSSKSKANFQGV